MPADVTSRWVLSEIANKAYLCASIVSTVNFVFQPVLLTRDWVGTSVYFYLAIQSVFLLVALFLWLSMLWFLFRYDSPFGLRTVGWLILLLIMVHLGAAIYYLARYRTVAPKLKSVRNIDEELRPETVHTPKRLLILDDERVMTDTLCIILKQHGYRTRGAYTHSQALAVAQVFQPDIFLTGFNNGCDENGFETAAALLAFLPRCRVLIFSGSASAADALQEYRERGYAFEVLAKPVHPQDLLERLRLARRPSG